MFTEDVITQIHSKNLKAVQLLTERFHWKNWGFPEGLGEAPFKDCPEKRCYAFKNSRFFQNPLERADGVILHVPNFFYMPSKNSYKRNKKQLWMFYTMEPQRRSFCSHLYDINELDDWFNLTATFKLNSDALMDYKEFSNWNTILYNRRYLNAFNDVKQKLNINTAISRKKYFDKGSFIFWFVSNCETPSRRELYVNELLKHVKIDIYGSCNNYFPNSKPDPCKKGDSNCVKNLYNSYKFYLSFENSQCNEYITEKFWKFYYPELFFNVDIVPVVRGARDEDYKSITKSHSYIYADGFKTAKDLADYLIYLNENNTAYLEYFKWKKNLIKEFNKDQQGFELEVPKFKAPFCELCSKLHNQSYLNQNNDIVKISEVFNPNKDCKDFGHRRWYFDWLVKLVGFCI